MAYVYVSPGRFRDSVTGKVVNSANGQIPRAATPQTITGQKPAGTTTTQKPTNQTGQIAAGAPRPAAGTLTGPSRTNVSTGSNAGTRPGDTIQASTGTVAAADKPEYDRLVGKLADPQLSPANRAQIESRLKFKGWTFPAGYVMGVGAPGATPPAGDNPANGNPADPAPSGPSQEQIDAINAQMRALFPELKANTQDTAIVFDDQNPAYKLRQDEAQKAIDMRLAARGLGRSGFQERVQANSNRDLQAAEQSRVDVLEQARQTANREELARIDNMKAEQGNRLERILQNAVLNAQNNRDFGYKGLQDAINLELGQSPAGEGFESTKINADLKQKLTNAISTYISNNYKTGSGSSGTGSSGTPTPPQSGNNMTSLLNILGGYGSNMQGYDLFNNILGSVFSGA
jgi:hypothetical protein